NHGFDEIDGPTFEHLDLYTVKSGPGIVSELFSFRRQGGDVDYALRPEFTPTLARMYAAQARSLPKPTRWFSIGPFFRAERPQRGRLREHIQWNVDIIGDDSPDADVQIVAVTVSALERLGLTSKEVRIRINHRVDLHRTLVGFGIPQDRLEVAFALVDAVEKLPRDEFKKRAIELGLDKDRWDEFTRLLSQQVPATEMAAGGASNEDRRLEHLEALHDRIVQGGFLEWCTYAPSLARGLAYYTGTVFEVHEVRGKERAIAGGGRYDNLIELFGGPPTPAVGIAMGDVVLRLVLEERGLLKKVDECAPRPDAFLIAAKEAADQQFAALLASLRRAGLHVRHSDRSTRNVGKLLGEAGKAKARFAVILGDELAEGCVAVKDLASGEQRNVPLERLEDELRTGS
ncbi:MAG: histidine--tRNA ligase, partial [Planctomycetota bacterium]